MLDADIDGKSWYVLYTRSRHEKKLNGILQQRNMVTYLPLIKSMRQWSDRKKKVEEPLFKSYLFVKATSQEISSLLNLEGAVKFVTFEGHPAIVRQEVIDEIKILLESPELIDVHDFFKIPGEPVIVTYGPFKGIRGTWVTYKGRGRVMMQIQELGKSILMDLPKHALKSDK